MDGDAIAWRVVAASFGLLAGMARSAGAGPRRAARPPVHSASGWSVQSAELRRIARAAACSGTWPASSCGQGSTAARRALEELRTRDEERRASDGEQREVVRRLATVLAGGAAKGRSGEHVLREHLAQLPPSMLVARLPRGRQGRGVRPACSRTGGGCRSTRSGPRSRSSRRSRPPTDPVTRDACARAVEKAVACAREGGRAVPRSGGDGAGRGRGGPRRRVRGAEARARRRVREGRRDRAVLARRCRSCCSSTPRAAIRRRRRRAGRASRRSRACSTPWRRSSRTASRRRRRCSTNGTDELRSQLGKARGLDRPRAGAGRGWTRPDEAPLSLIG